MGRWSLRGKPVNLAVAFAAVALLAGTSTGGVYVTSLPAGADVWVDGTYLGHSPLLLDAVAPGTHRLTLTRTGWASQDVGITVTPATTVTASIVLERTPGRSIETLGSIAIHGGPVGGVAIDGEMKPLGKDGSLVVPAGMHTVEFRLAHGKLTRTVSVYPDMRTDVIVDGSAPSRSVVIAPADDYLPADALTLAGTALTVRYRHHEVSARIGSTSYTVDRRTTVYDAAPTLIKNRMYLPIELLTMLTAGDS